MKPRKPRSRRIMEVTTPQIKKYLKMAQKEIVEWKGLVKLLKKELLARKKWKKQ